MSNMSKIKTKMNFMQGYFKAESFENDKCIYAYEKENKVVLGAGRAISRLLGGRTQNWLPTSSLSGIHKFVLFGIDNTVVDPDCTAEMLAGDFEDDYDDLDPISYTEIDITSFPCLKVSDTIVISTIPVNNCAALVTPASDTATMSSDIGTNYIDICARIGLGWAAVGQTKYYALAALLARSTNPSDTTEYVVCMEEFPVMSKNSNVTFKFLWQLYI